ncbi:hypothetical protein [Melghirimyces algeriensis]|uniref:Uncharacterized protein n=1 Tax=Melghirimyces algeriensis TaxID=910412 RepID=A0A521AD77_9BACL|nr:hypothetical protein [Melghirimyces algeriensis]SMO32726.1 hypothetical protein SAMN06264849_10166 [Melghirimyces algeriensis]
MHTGEYGWVTEHGETIHLKDDDCPVSSAIMKGDRKARQVHIETAREEGYQICRHCWKEFQEDLGELMGGSLEESD